MVLVTPPDNKDTLTLADILCNVAKERGVTEFRMLDHDIEPMSQEGR